MTWIADFVLYGGKALSFERIGHCLGAVHPVPIAVALVEITGPLDHIVPGSPTEQSVDIYAVRICGLAICLELIAESRALAVLDCDHRVVSSLASLASRASRAGEVLCPRGHIWGITAKSSSLEQASARQVIQDPKMPDMKSSRQRRGAVEGEPLEPTALFQWLCFRTAEPLNHFSTVFSTASFNGSTNLNYLLVPRPLRTSTVMNHHVPVLLTGLGCTHSI